VDPGSSSSSPEHVPPSPGPVGRATAPRWGLGDFAWIYVAGIVASVIGTSVGFALTGDTADHIGAVTTALTTFAQFGTWFGAVVWVARTKGHSVRADFGLVVHRRDWWVPLAGVAIYAVAWGLIEPLVRMANENQAVVDDLDKAGGAKLFVFAIVAAVIAPVCEELLFRGLLLRSLRRKMTPVAAVIVTALAFALAHPLLSPTLGDLAVVPALFLLGAISGVVAVRRGDLSASIMLHVGFNLVATVGAVYTHFR
jgi:membrane protease YdiL (CAAX protease family)